GFDLLAHEYGEYLVGLDGVVEFYAFEGAGLGVHGGVPQLVGVHLAETLEAAYLYLRVGVAGAHLGADLVALGVGVGHAALLAAGELVERRHGGVDIAVLDQRAHIAEEEGQQQRAYVAAVN